jgi:hypothetical protein
MRALKALVIGMGVLIAAGLGVVVFAIVDRLGEPKPQTPPAAQAKQANAPVAPKKTVRDLRIVLPPGAEIVESRLAGGQLMIRLKHADGIESFEIYDTETGRRLRRITIDRPR